MTPPDDRRKALQILYEGIADGARAIELARLLGVGLTTLQRWRRQFKRNEGGIDGRKGSHRIVCHRLSAEERQRILLTCNKPEFAALPSWQIVLILADRGLFISSERSFYRSAACPRASQLATLYTIKHSGELIINKFTDLGGFQ